MLSHSDLLCRKEAERAIEFTYDPRYNIAYIRFRAEKSAVDSIRVSDEFIVDIAPDGKVYGIELLNANEQLKREDINTLIVINEATGERFELPLAVAKVE